MTSLEFLELLNNVSDKYVAEARTPARKRLSLGRSLLVAAIILMSLLLVGCTVAYVNGWFTDYFSARSENPLTPEQVEFIQEHEQIIQAPQAKGDWTVELKSAICDGNNAYVIFGITAPEDVDLEDTNLSTGADRDRIIPGNASSMVRDPESPIPFTNSMSTTSVLCISPEYNTVWRDSCRWEPDNDGLPNTLNYVFSITIDKYDPSKEILLEDPFASEIEFQFVFQDFIRTWEDPEKRDAAVALLSWLTQKESIRALGGHPVHLMGEAKYFRHVYVWSGIWQEMGWGSIIYLAAITGIDAELYEAATIDGAGRLRKIWSVTLPCIRGTMVTLLIMNLGRVMGSNFERLDSFGNVQVKDFQYQLAIYIYEKGLAGSNFSRATAVGLFQSLTGLLLVLGSDWVSKRLGEDGLL